MLTGRWWEGRILINLCGNINVRNCDLLQSDFFARCRTVLEVAKGFFRRVQWNLGKDEAPKRCEFLRWRNMLLKATFKRSFWVLFGVKSAVTEKWLSIRTARYIFMSVKNMPSSQHNIIYSPPIGCSAPLYSPPKRCEQHHPKTGCVGWVFGKPPLIADASTTICTRFISRAAPLCPNLDCNLCPILTAH